MKKLLLEFPHISGRYSKEKIPYFIDFRIELYEDDSLSEEESGRLKSKLLTILTRTNKVFIPYKTKYLCYNLQTDKLEHHIFSKNDLNVNKDCILPTFWKKFAIEENFIDYMDYILSHDSKH